MKSLYDQHKDAFDWIAHAGAPNVRDAAKCLHTPEQLNRALGYEAAAKNWITKKNRAGASADRKAAAWLRENGHITVGPAATQTPQTTPPDVMLMVVGPAAAAAKMQKIASILGCEVVEI